MGFGLPNTLTYTPFDNHVRACTPATRRPCGSAACCQAPSATVAYPYLLYSWLPYTRPDTRFGASAMLSIAPPKSLKDPLILKPCQQSLPTDASRCHCSPNACMCGSKLATPKHFASPAADMLPYECLSQVCDSWQLSHLFVHDSSSEAYYISASARFKTFADARRQARRHTDHV